MRRERLASSSSRWDTLASSALLSTRDGVSSPSPSRARSASTEDINWNSRAGNSSGDTRNSKTGNWDTGGWLSSWRSVLVILLDDDTVLADVGESDSLIGDVLDGSLGARNGLDTDTVLGVDDLRVENLDGVNGIVVTTADGTDGETVSTSAGSTGEVDVSTRVDGETIILVDNNRVGDSNVGGSSNIESISVVTLSVTVLVVHGDLVDGQGSGTVDGHHLNWGVFEG
jgi:hypothetical protein